MGAFEEQVVQEILVSSYNTHHIVCQVYMFRCIQVVYCLHSHQKRNCYLVDKAYTPEDKGVGMVEGMVEGIVASMVEGMEEGMEASMEAGMVAGIEVGMEQGMVVGR